MSRETSGGGGSNAGAPTLTTPTLTPTTLRNIEQMFADRDPHEPPPHHLNAAGFVPPIIRLTITITITTTCLQVLNVSFQPEQRIFILKPELFNLLAAQPDDSHRRGAGCPAGAGGPPAGADQSRPV